MDVGTVPPPWPFSSSVSVCPSAPSVPERQLEEVWWAERPPLAEEEPDFAGEDFNTVCVTSSPLKVPTGRDVERKSSLTTDKPSNVSNEEAPVLTPVTLFTEDEEESPEQAEPKEKPKEELVSETHVNWSDEDKVTITDNIICSLLRSECEEEKNTEPHHGSVKDTR